MPLEPHQCCGPATRWVGFGGPAAARAVEDPDAAEPPIRGVRASTPTAATTTSFFICPPRADDGHLPPEWGRSPGAAPFILSAEMQRKAAKPRLRAICGADSKDSQVSPSRRVFARRRQPTGQLCPCSSDGLGWPSAVADVDYDARRVPQSQD